MTEPTDLIERPRGLSKRIGDTGLRVEAGAQWPWTYNLICGDIGIASFDVTGWRHLRSILSRAQQGGGDGRG